MNLANATIAQLLIPVDDFERAVVFYRDVLGLPLLFSAPPQMAFFRCGTVRLLVGVTPAGQPVQRGSQIYFGVQDIHAVHASLSQRGVEFKVALTSSAAPRKAKFGWQNSSIPMATSLH